MKNQKINRRNFVGSMSCAALGYATLSNSIINLKAINALASANSALDPGYKALVCIMKSGGNDSYNMLVPTTPDEYKLYKETRSQIALDSKDILSLNTINTPGRTFGLHPSMTGIRKMFNEGKVSFISNIGTLVEPVKRDQVYLQNAKLPLGLLSHSDQSQQWQTAVLNDRASSGWGGRMADLIKDQNKEQNISMNISISGTNLFQEGNETIEYVIDRREGSTGITGYGVQGEWDYFNKARTRALDSLIDHNYKDIFQKAYMDVIRSGRDGHLKFSEALGSVPEFQTVYSETELSDSLKMIARTIASHEKLGFKRQIFFVDYYGWDHHDEVLQNQLDMLGEVDDAMTSFYNTLEELNLTKQVTTFTVSEFGRSLTSNGNGTDHAWGGNVMVMGGDLFGSRIFGTYPSMDLQDELNVYDGVLIPTTPVDLYFAELALWMGVSRNDLAYLFPNLSNVYNINSGAAPLGFLHL